MIKAIILDVDGVIVGEKIGLNSPWPHSKVIKKLKEIKSKGIAISLCTAKPHFSIGKIIKDANLDNLHITDGGGVIINPLKNRIVKKHLIDSQLASQVIELFLKNKVYIEFYTVDDYVIQKNQVCEITKGHAHVLQRKAKIVDFLPKEALKSEITKLMPIAKDEKDKERLIKLFTSFKDQLTLSWGVHPVVLPLQFGIITAPGISKKEGAIAIAKNQKIPFKYFLGVGDSASDWQFIQMCQHGGAMGNASQELKDLVLSKGEKYSFIGPTVDKNGIIEILEYFIK